MRQLRVKRASASLTMHVGAHEGTGCDHAKAISLRRLDRPLGKRVGNASSAESGGERFFILASAFAARTGKDSSRCKGRFAGGSSLVGILLELRSPVGTALGLVGNVLFFVVLIGLGLSMWRRASSPATHDDDGRAPRDYEGRTSRSVSHVEQAKAQIKAAEAAVDNP